MVLLLVGCWVLTVVDERLVELPLAFIATLWIWLGVLLFARHRVRRPAEGSACGTSIVPEPGRLAGSTLGLGSVR